MSNQQDTLTEQDPDYASSVPNNEVQQKAFEQNARASTVIKLREIFDREFSKEIDAKKKEVLEIQERLQKALTSLHILRYVIVTDYYNRKQCQLPETQSDSKQTRIHPAIKRLIGKHPRGIESNFIDVASDPLADQSDSNGSEKPSSSKESCSFDDPEKDTETCMAKAGSKRTYEEEPGPAEVPKKIPRYIPPKSSSPEPAIPSRGVHNKTRRRVIIGNVSEWIPPEWRDDAASHKWTVYVRSSKNEVDISEFVSKVRFFLHPTYKPHDVVEITSYPFHLTRRGWGEFPIRVQLHFKNNLNKPTDVIHHLKLDQTYTGIRTLGSETVVDVWLQNSNSSNQVSETKDQRKLKGKSLARPNNAPTSLTFQPSTPTSETPEIEVVDEKVKKLKLCIRNEHDYAAMDYVVDNNRTIVHIPNGTESNHNNPEISPSDCHQNDVNLPQINGTDKMSEEELAIVASNANKHVANQQSASSMAMSFKNCSSKVRPLNIVIPEFETSKKQLLLVKNKQQIKSIEALKNCAIQKLNVESSVSEKNSEKKKAEDGKPVSNAKSIFLPTAKSFIFNPNSYEPTLQIAEKRRNGDVQSDEFLHEKEKKGKVGGKDKQQPRKNLAWTRAMRSISSYQYADTVSLVKFIINRVPMITKEAADPEYKKLNPYACETLDEYMSYNVGKQKYYEWARAKAVRSIMKNCVTTKDDLWTMKEIMTWARQHGYTPMSSNICGRKSSLKSAAEESNSANTISCTRTELTELEDWFVKCQDENDAQSDVEIDIENVSDENSETKKISRIQNTSDLNAEDSNFELLEMPSDLEPLYSFVSKATRESGGKTLNNETVVPGIKHCKAARVMIQALQCLVGDITRLAHAQAVERISNSDSNNKTPPVIIDSDIKGALLMREEFDIFTNAGLGTKQHNNE